MQADRAENVLTNWQKDVEIFRKKYQLLVFFSNIKAINLYFHILKSSANTSMIVQEISFIFPNNKETSMRLHNNVQVPIYIFS